MEELKELEIRLENLKEGEDEMEILKKFLEKKEIEMALSKELGSVIN